MNFKPALRVIVFYELVVTIICVATYNRAFFLWQENLALAGFVLSLPVFIFYVLQRLFTSYQITEGRVSMWKGLIWRRAMHIPIQRITDMSVSRRLLPRMLGVGTVFLNSAGSDITEMTLRDVPNDKLRRAAAELDRLLAIEKGSPALQKAVVVESNS